MSKRTHEDRKKAEDDAPVFKVPNKEMIVTRGKSTQMRRQLRSKDGSPKASSSPTQPQKVAKPTAKAVPKLPMAKLSPPAEKSLKTVKKVILKPPQKLRKVEPGRAEKKVVNKRKATRPQKQVLQIAFKQSKDSCPKSKAAATKMSGSKSADSFSAQVSSTSLKQRYLEDKRKKDLSFAELIQLREKTEELTDEDLLEIAMCPSPVWWEDPSDDQYDEDHIFVRSSADQADTKTKVAAADMKNDHTTKCESEEQSTLEVSRIPDSKYDQGFNKKRSALENVLCGIITKVGKSNDNALNQSCTPLSANKHKLDKVVSKDLSQECSKQNAIDNYEMQIFEKSIDEHDKDVELVEVSMSKLSSKNTYNQATSTSDTAMEMLKKIHAHLPKIRNVTANCMKMIEKGKQFQVKRVYSGNDSAELIPTKSKRRLDVFIDLSEETDIDKNRTDVAVPTTFSNDLAPDSVNSESVKNMSNRTDEDDVLKDLENLVIPIALPIESSECIVIDEDEEKVDCEKNEPFLGVRESAETQPVSCSKVTIIDVDSDSENLKEISSSSGSERDSKSQEERGSAEILFVSQEKTRFPQGKEEEPLSNILLKKSCENDLKNPEKKKIVFNNVDNVDNTSVKGNNSSNTETFSLRNNRQVSFNSLSNCDTISATISDTNIQFSHEDQLLEDTNVSTKRITCPPKVIERESKPFTTTNRCINVKRSSMNSKIQQAYRELISRIVNKRNALKENVPKQNVAQKCESQIATVSKQEIISLNSSIDSIKDPDEELVAKESETKATVQVFNSLETVPEADITYEVVTSEDTLLESLKQDTLSSGENLDENVQFPNLGTAKAEYDQEGESDYQDCEYEQISETPMTKEMIENIIGVQEAKESASDPEALEQNGFNSKCEPSKQNIVIAQSENVKYCFNCSSIYDTDECRYCQRKGDMSKQLEKVFACKKCTYRSMKRSNMEAHALTHTKEKPFSCDRCKASFKTKATLKNHLSKCCSGSNRREYTLQSDESYKLQYAKVSTEEKMIADGNEIIVILAES